MTTNSISSIYNIDVLPFLHQVHNKFIRTKYCNRGYRVIKLIKKMMPVGAVETSSGKSDFRIKNKGKR